MRVTGSLGPPRLRPAGSTSSITTGSTTGTTFGTTIGSTTGSTPPTRSNGGSPACKDSNGGLLIEHLSMNVKEKALQPSLKSREQVPNQESPFRKPPSGSPPKPVGPVHVARGARARERARFYIIEEGSAVAQRGGAEVMSYAVGDALVWRKTPLQRIVPFRTFDSCRGSVPSA